MHTTTKQAKGKGKGNGVFSVDLKKKKRKSHCCEEHASILCFARRKKEKIILTFTFRKNIVCCSSVLFFYFCVHVSYSFIEVVSLILFFGGGHKWKMKPLFFSMKITWERGSIRFEKEKHLCRNFCFLFARIFFLSVYFHFIVIRTWKW